MFTNVLSIFGTCLPFVVSPQCKVMLPFPSTQRRQKSWSYQATHPSGARMSTARSMGNPMVFHSKIAGRETTWMLNDAHPCSSMFKHHLKWFDDLYSCCSITLEHIGTTPASIDVQVLHCRSPLRWVPTSSWTRIRWRLGIFWGPQKSSLETQFFICCNGETLQWSPGKLWLTGNLVMFKEEVSETLSMDSHGASLLRRPTQDPSMAHVES